VPAVTIDHVTVCAGLLVPVTVAEKILDPPCATITVDGFTVTPVTVDAGGSVPPPPSDDDGLHPITTNPNAATKASIPNTKMFFFILLLQNI
jgi:hypothetical protein